jgi:hypothetical protein
MESDPERSSLMKTAGALAAVILALSLVSMETAGAADDTITPPFGVWDGSPAPRVSGPSVLLLGYLWGINRSPTPRYGCYFTRLRTQGKWLRAEVCY